MTGNIRPVTRGRREGEDPRENFPSWKNVWDTNLKILDIVQKIWASLP